MEEGVYSYWARFYDNALGRFISADTLIPQPGSPLAWDRYAYANGNPVRFNDPSGHMSCEGTNYCGPSVIPQYQDLISELTGNGEDEYGWQLDGIWSYKEVKALLQTARDIRTYVSNLTAGQGKEWMDKFLKPVFSHGELSGHNSFVPAGQFVHLAKGWANSVRPGRHIAHELAHGIDNETAGNLVRTAVWWNSGWSSELVEFVGGNPNTLLPHWINGTAGISSENQWRNAGDPDKKGRNYGNYSSADYFAETFAYSVYPSGDTNVPEQAQYWLMIQISNSIPR